MEIQKKGLCVIQTTELLVQKLYAFARCYKMYNVTFFYFKFTVLLHSLKQYVFRSSVYSKSSNIS